MVLSAMAAATTSDQPSFPELTLDYRVLAGADYDRPLARLEDAPDVVLYRVAVGSAFPELASAGSFLPRPVHLAANTQGNIAVIYPDIGEPFRGVFNKIIEGIEDKTRSRVASYPIGANQSAQELSGELRRQNVQVVIALGRHGLKAASGLDREIGVIAGGVLSVPESEVRGMSVYSLAPDPALLFDRLKSMMPAARRIYTIYDPRQNGWLIRLARDAARNLGLELIAQEASDLKGAMRLYQETLAGMDPKKDALWLPQDSVTVEDTSVMPLVLQEAWNRGLPVFSSNVAHVKRGVLFSLYPNNIEVGRSLASSALGQLSSGRHNAAIIPLKEVLIAVNMRTAGHLGLPLVQRQVQSFDMVFPEP